FGRRAHRCEQEHSSRSSSTACEKHWLSPLRNPYPHAASARGPGGKIPSYRGVGQFDGEFATRFEAAPFHFKREGRFQRSPAPALRQTPYSDLSIFQKIGVAGPSSTPLSDLRHALGMRNCPSGM